MSSKANKGSSYILVLFAMALVFSMSMVITRLVTTDATITSNAVATSGLFAMARGGIDLGMYHISNHIQTNIETIKYYANYQLLYNPYMLYNEYIDILLAQALQYVQTISLTHTRGAYQLHININHANNVLTVRSVSSRQGILPTTTLQAVIHLHTKVELIANEYYTYPVFIKPISPTLHTFYEIF